MLLYLYLIGETMLLYLCLIGETMLVDLYLSERLYHIITIFISYSRSYVIIFIYKVYSWGWPPPISSSTHTGRHQ